MYSVVTSMCMYGVVTSMCMRKPLMSGSALGSAGKQEAELSRAPRETDLSRAPRDRPLPSSERRTSHELRERRTSPEVPLGVPATKLRARDARQSLISLHTRAAHSYHFCSSLIPNSFFFCEAGFRKGCERRRHSDGG